MVEFSTEMTLEEFTRWWLGERPFRPPLGGVSQPSLLSSGVVIYRNGPFQVQLFIFHPGCRIPPHRHGSVDSYEHYLCGQVYFHKNGQELLPKEDFYENADGIAAPFVNTRRSCMVHVKPRDWHGAEVGELGGSFLSIQRWSTGECGLIEFDWEGSVLDSLHERQL